MRVTKKMLIKSNKRKNVVIFIMLAICFVSVITVSVQFVQIKNLLEKQSNGIKLTVTNTEKNN